MCYFFYIEVAEFVVGVELDLLLQFLELFGDWLALFI